MGIDSDVELSKTGIKVILSINPVFYVYFLFASSTMVTNLSMRGDYHEDRYNQANIAYN